MGAATGYKEEASRRLIEVFELSGGCVGISELQERIGGIQT